MLRNSSVQVNAALLCTTPTHLCKYIRTRPRTNAESAAVRCTRPPYNPAQRPAVKPSFPCRYPRSMQAWKKQKHNDQTYRKIADKRHCGYIIEMLLTEMRKTSAGLEQ
jgi:hypothetical protein